VNTERAPSTFGAVLYRYLQYRAQGVAQRAVKQGRLPQAKRLRCVDCDGRAEVYDHRDYLKPLEVVPVCQGCNKRRGPADIDQMVESFKRLLWRAN
jgi:hypothetical protein